MWLVMLLVAVTAARDVTDEEYAKFPRLYHLDDYSSCLSQSGGLYCVGTFQLAPLQELDPTFDAMKVDQPCGGGVNTNLVVKPPSIPRGCRKRRLREHAETITALTGGTFMDRAYSLDPHHFDRTELHRGYCVSSRCPALATERNTSLRFERCAAHWGRRRSLRTTLSKLSYCRTSAQEYASAHSPPPLDVPQRVFLFVLTALLVFNTLGTIYDLMTGDDAKKNPLLLSWSVRANLHRLTATYEGGDPRLSALSPVQGIRVLLMVLIIATHSGCIHDMLYLYNPRWIEQISRHPVLMIFLNGTSVVQIFVMVSNFLLAYNMLLYGKSNPIKFKMLPLIILKRIARLSPVHLLVVGYAATWWVRAGAGPVWPTMVGAESQACRAKFWTHVFYVNNLIDADNICLVQTWFLAVDMQLHLVAAFLTFALASVRRHALPVLAVLVVASSVLNGALAYVFNWQSVMFFSYPRTLRTMYHGIPSFTKLYQSPWGSLPGSLVGIFCAFLHFNMQEAGVKITSYRWLKLPYYLAPLAIVGWMLSGYYLRQYTEPWFLAAYVAIERPVLSSLGGLVLIGMVNGLEGWLKQLFAWRGWSAMGRVSLSVLAVHWCVNMSMAAARPQPISSSLLNVAIDTVATGFFSYALAVPLAVMVEMPVQRTVSALLF